jgi:hypothetical protein
MQRPQDWRSPAAAAPGASKSAKRREKDKAKQRTLAEQLGARNAVRVLHASSGERSAPDLALAANDFPTLSGSASTPDLQVRGIECPLGTCSKYWHDLSLAWCPACGQAAVDFWAVPGCSGC